MSEYRKVGFIGTGIMRAPMIARLPAAGFVVTAWNRTPSKSKSRGTTVRHAASAAMAAENADPVICMLSSGPACDEVLLESGGLIEAMRPGALLVVMSSIPTGVPVAHALAASN